MRRWILLSLAILGLLVAGAGVAVYFKSRDRPQGKLDTELKGVSVGTADTRAITEPKKKKGHRLVDDKRCWLEFGGNPQRTLSRPAVDIGLPYRRFWSVGLGSYIEYPPSYCGGILYVNTFGGKTVALNSHNGQRIWQVQGGRKPSTPAIAGPRLIVSSHDGYVTAYNRFNGRRLWRLKVAGKVESSPVAVGRRLFTISRSGGVYALSTGDGHVVWRSSVNSWGYATPAVAHGRVFFGGFDGRVRALRASTGQLIWSRHLGGRFLGPAFVAGKYVFASNLERNTYALRAADGKVMWHLDIGKYSPGIVTDRHYFFTLNGIVQAWHGRRAPQILELKRRLAAQHRVATTPKKRAP